MSVLDNIKEKVINANSILILTHENPDGDAIGSSLALYNALKKIEKNVTVYIPEPDKMFSYLPGYGDMQIGKELPDHTKFDLAIALDTSDVDRLGIAKEVFADIEETVSIDHHITNQNYADVNYVNAVASSTCENLTVVLAILEIPINKEIAECIYTGILTDTGGFRYNITPETMEIAATVMESGINTAKIYRTIFDVTTLNRTKLVGRCIDRLETLEDGKIAFTYMTLEDLKQLQLEESDSEGIVNFGRNIDTVEVSIFAKEREDGSHKYSLRANEYVDVSIIASKFGGGGHARAAGCDSAVPMEQVKQILIEEIKKQLK